MRALNRGSYLFHFCFINHSTRKTVNNNLTLCDQSSSIWELVWPDRPVFSCHNSRRGVCWRQLFRLRRCGFISLGYSSNLLLKIWLWIESKSTGYIKMQWFIWWWPSQTSSWQSSPLPLPLRCVTSNEPQPLQTNFLHPSATLRQQQSDWLRWNTLSIQY